MKQATILMIIVMLVMGAVLMAGCSPSDDQQPTQSDEQPSPDETLPDDDANGGAAGSLIVPQVQGIVQEIEDGDAMRILVDSDAEVEGLIWVTITDETSFFEDVGEDSSLGISNVSRDFKAGNHVAIYVGDIAESYPMQTQALAVYENSEQ